MTALLAVSPESEWVGEADLIQDLLDHGLERYHLRKPAWSEQQVAGLLSQLQEESLTRISIHQHPQLCQHFPVGLHLKDNSAYEFRKRVSRGPVSRSLHTIEAIEGSGEALDYCFLSPVFPSLSKTGYVPAWSREELCKRLSTGRTTALYALGGIGADNFQEALNLGFDGVVLHGVLWQSDDPLRVLSLMTKVAL